MTWEEKLEALMSIGGYNVGLAMRAPGNWYVTGCPMLIDGIFERGPTQRAAADLTRYLGLLVLMLGRVAFAREQVRFGRMSLAFHKSRTT